MCVLPVMAGKLVLYTYVYTRYVSKFVLLIEFTLLYTRTHVSTFVGSGR